MRRSQTLLSPNARPAVGRWSKEQKVMTWLPCSHPLYFLTFCTLCSQVKGSYCTSLSIHGQLHFSAMTRLPLRSTPGLRAASSPKPSCGASGQPCRSRRARAASAAVAQGIEGSPCGRHTSSGSRPIGLHHTPIWTGSQPFELELRPG